MEMTLLLNYCLCNCSILLLAWKIIICDEALLQKDQQYDKSDSCLNHSVLSDLSHCIASNFLYNLHMHFVQVIISVSIVFIFIIIHRSACQVVDSFWSNTILGIQTCGW